MGAISDFMETNFRHFNARETLNAAKAWNAHLEAGGKMMVALAGAMSTAKIGQTLAPLIREDKVHAICCTGANLEEDVFNLLAYDDYEIIEDWRALRAEDEKELYDRGFNRVTDTCIPESVMRHFEDRIMVKWQEACEKSERYLPHEFLYSVLRDETLHALFQIPREESWTFAAMEKDLPVYAPGWEDSTTGNMFAAAVVEGKLPHHQCVKTGTEQMEHLLDWYLTHSGMPDTPTAGCPSVGFFQIGGGIAGDFAICAVPTLIQDLKRADVPFWGYFCQIGDAPTSYGGYSGAVPNEKITWGKLDVETPKFMIQSDATIVAPLIFAYVRGR
jgi:deoxyhypusine synthase